MKIKLNTKPAGSILLVALLTAVIFGIALASYMSMVSAQNQSTMRSLSWNTGIPVTEAGIEEALTQLHYTGIVNLSANSWTSLGGGLYSKQRSFPDGSKYYVTIQASNPPIITSTGSVIPPMTSSSYYGMIFGAILGSGNPAYVSRTVVVSVTNAPLFSKAMVSLGKIDMNGNNVATDSFDSMDPLYSTGGLYDASKSKDNGDVGTISGLVNIFSVGNANIKGHAYTGPGGTISVGSQGTVGDAAWVDGNKHGVQPGHFSDDLNVQFPDVTAPFTTAPAPLNNVLVGSTTYKYALASGNYMMDSLSGSLYVGGNAVLYVPGNADLSGIVLGPGASILIYNGTSNASSSQSVGIAGNGAANNGGHAWNFQYYGLPSIKSISYSGNAAFTGVMYAPEADLSLKGGGNNKYDFVGSSVTASVTMNGHFNFHYDESLAKYGPNRNYVITSWNEQ